MNESCFFFSQPALENNKIPFLSSFLWFQRITFQRFQLKFVHQSDFPFSSSYMTIRVPHFQKVLYPLWRSKFNKTQVSMLRCISNPRSEPLLPLLLQNLYPLSLWNIQKDEESHNSILSWFRFQSSNLKEPIFEHKYLLIGAIFFSISIQYGKIDVAYPCFHQIQAKELWVFKRKSILFYFVN